MNSKQFCRTLLCLCLTTLLLLLYNSDKSSNEIQIVNVTRFFDVHNFSTYPLADQEILHKLRKLQAESNCSSQKLLVFDVSVHPFGFGSQLHQIATHLFTAFETNRTLIFYNSKLNNEFFRPTVMGHCNFDMNALSSASTDIMGDQIVFTNSQERVQQISRYKYMHGVIFLFFSGTYAGKIEF